MKNTFKRVYLGGKLKFILILVVIFLCPDFSYGGTSNLRLPLRGTKSTRARLYRQSFGARSEIVGGKCAWREVLEKLATRIGFKIVPNPVRFTIEELWGAFIEHKPNKKLKEMTNQNLALHF